jgi:hypothetical protein
MERTMWTDERLNDRFDGLDRRLDRVDMDLRELRTLVFQLWGSNIAGLLIVIATIVFTRA